MRGHHAKCHRRANEKHLCGALPHRPPSPRGAPQGQSSEDPGGVTGVQRSPGEDVHMLVSKHQLAQPTRMSADMSNKEQVFAQLKKDVRSLLISSKLGLDPNQLTRDYGNMLGCPMPLQLLGFGNVLDMAAAMPDVLSVSRGVNGVALLKAVSDTSTKHIEELVAKQRNPKKRNHFHQYQPSPLQHHPFLSIHTLRAQLKILLCQGPLKLCDLNACYLRCFHRPLLPCEFGFDTLGGMLEAVADLIFVQPSNMGLIVSLRENAMPTNHYGLFYTPNWVKTRPPKYSHGRRPKQGKPSEPPSSQPTAVAERKDQEADLELSQKPVLERPSGKDAPPIENSHFPVRPAEGDNGHCTVVDLGSVGQRAHGGGEIKGEGDRCAARARQDETSEISEDSRTPEESAATPPAAEVRHGSAIARDVLGTQRLKRPTPHGVRDLAAVRVEHVESPGHFYVSFVESDEARALQDLMFEMRRCYTCSEVSEHYRLPQRLVRRGQACCVSAIGFWFYRVVIRQVVSATRAEVYFVDYGNTTTVHSADLKFLRARFSVLPAQAVPSSLAGIKPITGTWTPEATSSFQELCSHHVLAGALYSYVGDVLQLYLCDTRTSDDVYVHDVLLSQGHAVACAPPAGAALCAEDSPVTLYLGDGSVDPQEDVAVSLKVEDDEMPDLELIVDEQLSSHFQILNGLLRRYPRLQAKRKSSRAKEKKARRLEERAAMDAVCAKVDAANKLNDPLDSFPAFKKYDRNGLNLQIECKRVTALNPLSVEWAFELTRANMQTLYEQSEWGWKEREKREEMNDERAWYLLARDGDSAPVAFSHFRFDVECGEEVLYCYEVQLESRVRRKGLGKFLIQILQLIANGTQMKKVMLTVFKHNHGAYQFFRDALQFEMDETSPSMSGCCGDDCSYEILSRRTKHGEASVGHGHAGGHCGGCCH